MTDLTQADFEILEGGAPQTIEQFERVVVRAAGPQDTRVEPNTVRESRAMAEQSKARLFVLFLDTYHVDIGASHAIRKPLVEALDRVIGQDDLVAVMTPEMSANDIAFARRTTTIEGFLTRYWHWGDRDREQLRDPQDQAYADCYPNVNETGGSRQVHGPERSRRGDDRSAPREAGARCARRPGAIPAHGARGAQGDSGDH